MAEARTVPQRVRASMSAAEASYGVGLGCLMAWSVICFQTLNLYQDPGESTLDSVYLAAAVAQAVAFAAIAFGGGRPVRLATSNPAFVTTAVAMGACTALLPTGSTLGTAWASVVAGLVAGAASSLLVVRYGASVGRFPTRNVVPAVAIATVVTPVLVTLCTLFGAFEACMFAASLPFVSAMLLLVGDQSQRAQDGGRKAQKAPRKASQAQKANAAEPGDHDSTGGRGVGSVPRMVRSLSLCTALVGCADELCRTLYMQMGFAGGGAFQFAMAQSTTTLLLVVLGTALTLALMAANSARTPAYCYRLTLLALAVGMLMLPVPLVVPWASAAVPFAVTSAAYQCFTLLMWVLALGVCRHGGEGLPRLFARVRLGWALGPLAGMLVGRAVLHLTPFGLPEVYASMAFAVVLVMLTSAVAFTEGDLAQAMELMPVRRNRPFMDKCHKLAADHDLTPREEEVMVLFAKGRNLAYIQQELSLSKSTVSTHRQHIYQKLGVHSSQQMIDLIQSVDLDS